jgi:hypothetical protein
MARAIGFAVLFAVVGLVAFALLAPLTFPGGDLSRIGTTAFPVIVLVGGGIGLAIGLRSSRRGGKGQGGDHRRGRRSDRA